MNNDSPFSSEYDIGETTDIKVSQESRDKTIISDGIRKLIEDDIQYKLSKPRRKIIRAKIIDDKS